MSVSLVSAIIPVYNGETYITNMFEMLKMQTYKMLEVIVIDDGSTDNTKQVIDAYQKKETEFKIRFISKENEGVSVARNLGIDMAKGKYVIFIDCDDQINPLYIEKLVYSLESQSSSLAMCSYNIINNKNEILSTFNRKSGRISKNDLLNEILLPDSFKCTLWNKLFILDIILSHKIRFKPGIHIGEDFLFLVKYINATDSYFFIGESLYSYLKNEHGAMNVKNASFNLRHLTEWDTIKLVEDELKDIKEVKGNFYKKKVLIAHKLHRLLKQNNINDSYKKELRHFLIKNWHKTLMSNNIPFITKCSIFTNMI